MINELVFPAWAGVILQSLNALEFATSVPRMGGGDPGTWGELWIDDECSPHGRG